MVYGLGTIVPRLLNYLLLTPFYTRIFAPGEYGVITELYAYVAFLMVLLTYGMETTFFKFTSTEKNTKIVYNNALGSILITSAIFIGLVLFFNHGIATLIGYKNQSIYIVWFALIVAFDAITAVPFAKLRNENKALKFTVIKILNILINIGLNIFFFIICKNSNHELLKQLYEPKIGLGYAFLSNLIASGFNFLALNKEILGLKIQFDFTLYKKMWAYAWPLLVIGLAGMFNEQADKILIKHLSSENVDAMQQVGIYGANYKLAVLMSIFIQMFKYAAEPFFFKQAKEKDAKKVYANVMNYFIIFCLIILLLVTLYMDIFKYFIGIDFREGLFIVPIILYSNLLLGVFYNLSVWYKLTNRTVNGAVIALIGVVFTMVLNIILIPIIGILGSAWTHFVCYLVMVVISYFWGRKIYRINYPLKKIAVYNLITIVLVLTYNSFVNFSVVLNLSIASLMFFIFIVVIIKMEKINLSIIKELIKA